MSPELKLVSLFDACAELPAMEYADGHKEWHINGQLHRSNGPAIEPPDGTRHWYLNDEEVTEDEHRRRTGVEER